MTAPEVAAQALGEALAEALADDWPAAFKRLGDAFGDNPRDGFVAAFALAAVVTNKVAGGSPDATGPLVTEMERIGPDPDGDPTLGTALSYVMAFITAYGNGDHRGATTVYYDQLLAEDDPRVVAGFFRHLFEIAVSVVRPEAVTP